MWVSDFYFSWMDCIWSLILQHEIKTLNRKDFKMSANWLQMLTQLIEETQDDESEAAQICLREWMEERDQLRYV